MFDNSLEGINQRIGWPNYLRSRILHHSFRYSFWHVFQKTGRSPDFWLRQVSKVSVPCGAHRRPGTNLQALIDAQDTSALPGAEIVLVISNRKAAYGLTRAASANPPIPTGYLALQPYLKKNPEKTREDYDAEIARMVVEAKPDIVVLAGWMHILSERFLEIVEGRLSLSDLEPPTISIPVINLHPALPGAFDGANAIERAFDAFQKGEIEHSGCMIHRVVKDVDRGEPVLVREVKIEKGEALEAFEERLHRVEHEIIVQATKIILEEYVPSPSQQLMPRGGTYN
jgi:phosphoribosylglycinamide formyltransferase